MKIISYLLGVGLASLALIGSCSKDNNKSLSELKSEQSDAIERLQNNLKLKFVELKDNALPQTIDKSVYYHLKNGLYIKVLDEGNQSKKAELDKTKVFVVMKGYQFRKDTPKGASFDNLSEASATEIEFRYTYFYNAGAVHYTLIPNTRPVVTYDDLMCEGIAFPVSLDKLGDGARVSLIIPFDIGPSSTFSLGVSTYIEELRYTFR